MYIVQCTMYKVQSMYITTTMYSYMMQYNSQDGQVTSHILNASRRTKSKSDLSFY